MVFILYAILFSHTAPCEDGQVRLAGGGSFYWRVQVCGAGVWGTVCNDRFWDDMDASVVCRQLGFSAYGIM